MKTVFCALLSILICAAIVGCGSASDGKASQGKTVNDVLSEKINESAQASDVTSGQGANTSSSKAKNNDIGSVDVDLTKLSSTMVYSEVYNMTNAPTGYLGKMVRMRGSFAHTEENGKDYFACIISDATACCAQGIEFILKDARKFPDQYPSEGTEITVVGVFDTYTEGANQYCQLIDAYME